MPRAPDAIVRLDLGHRWLSEYPLEIPVHGFLIKHPDGAGLVDTGYGRPLELIKDYRPVNASVAAALRKHDVDPSDIRWIINSHLHFDHCGQNAVFPQAPLYVQRAEYERRRRQYPGGIPAVDLHIATFWFAKTSLLSAFPRACITAPFKLGSVAKVGGLR